MKFKVGDRVEIHKPTDTSKPPCWVDKMDKYDGQVVTLENLNSSQKYWKIDEWCFNEDWLIGEEKEMKKSQLQDGDIVEVRNGDRYIVFFGELKRKYEFLSLSNYSEDMINDFDSEFDIVKVKVQSVFPFKEIESKHIFWNWTRKETIEVTMKEVEEKFGCKVKIVKGEKNDC